MKKIKVFLWLISICVQLHGNWPESVLKKMTLEDKVAHLFMIKVQEKPKYQSTIEHREDETYLVKNYHVGGLIFFVGELKDQVKKVNELQKLSKSPLLVGQDSEWGLSMRLVDTMGYPRNMTLGAITDDSLLYELGKELGRQCRAVGVHINFAPVVDINTNLKNPIIGTRSFGDCKKKVAKKGMYIAKGLQDAGCLACAKHFPGHGDTSVDSHLNLPLITHSLERLEKEELYPFKKLIDGGVDAIMSAHLSIPAMDKSRMPASISRLIVTDLLKKRLGFKGLVFSDDLKMKGLAKLFSPEEVALRVLLAGNDVLLSHSHVESSIKYLVECVKKGIIDEKEIDERVLKILRVKEKLGLHKKCFISEDVSKLFTKKSKQLKKTLYEKAITVINNEDSLLPFDDTQKEEPKLGIVDIGEQAKDGNANFYLPLDAKRELCEKVFRDLKNFKNVVLRIFKVSHKQGRYGKVPGVEKNLLEFIKEAALLKSVAYVLCTSPYALPFLPKKPTIIAYENDVDAVKSAMDVLYGKKKGLGVLPIKN